MSGGERLLPICNPCGFKHIAPRAELSYLEKLLPCLEKIGNAPNAVGTPNFAMSEAIAQLVYENLDLKKRIEKLELVAGK